MIAYLNATPVKETQAEVLALQLPVVRDGQPRVVAPEAATVREIRAAAAAVRSGAGGGAMVMPTTGVPGPAAFVGKAQSALQPLGVRVGLDAMAVTFSPVPFVGLRQFVSTLKSLVGSG